MDLSSFEVMLTFLVILTAFSSLHAQNSRFNFEHLSLEQGLSHGRVLCMLQDSRGFMWFGTRNGLNRYDGNSFKVFKHDPSDSLTLSNSWIYCIYEDKFNTLWIGTDRGLNRFDRVSESFTQVLPIPGDSTDLSGNVVRTIFESVNDTSEALWIGTWQGHRQKNGGLYKLDRKSGKFTRYFYDPANPNSISDNAIRFIVEDDSGLFWIGTEQHGLNRFDTKTNIFKHYMHDPNNPNSIGENRVWSGIKDLSGNLWFGTFGGGMNKYNQQSDNFLHYKNSYPNLNSLHQDFIWTLFSDSFGKIWISNGVLSKFNQQDETFEHIKFSESQHDWRSSYAPLVIYEDNSFNLWIGTNGSGIYKIDLKPQKFSHYKHNPDNPTSLSDNEIRIIHEDQAGNIWIATRENGLNRFDPNREIFTHFKHDPDDAESLSSNIITVIYDDRIGNIWVGTDNGLNRIKPSNNTIVHFFLAKQNILNKSFSNNVVRTIYEDHRGTIWVGTAAGLNRLNQQTEKSIYYIIDPEADLMDRVNDIFDIHEDKFGNFLVAAWTGLHLFDYQKKKFKSANNSIIRIPEFGLSIFEDRNGTIWGRGLNTIDIKKKKVIRYRIRPNPTLQQGFDMTYNAISDIYEDASGMLWCASRMGLHKFDPQIRKYIAHYYEKDALLSNLVLKTVGDNLGNLWLLTSSGISIFNESKPPGEQFRNLTAETGIINTPSYRKAFIKSKSGDIYWGGANGIYRFHPDVKQTNPNIPNIQLTDFKLFNKSAKLDTAITEIKTIRLNYDENYFAFSFAALDFTNPKQNQYAYKLEGLDKDWIHVGNEHEANYTHVPPGKYTFRVIGSNNEDVWNQQGASVRIIIASPYWATWWFRSIILTIVLAIGYSFHRYRLQKCREIERTRNRIARDLHDDVSSSLSSIALTSELIESRDGLGKNEKRLLIRIRTTSQRIIEAMDDIVWAVNPDYDKLDNLLLKMKDFAAALFSKSDIAYAINFPERGCLDTCHMDFRRNLFLIFKEILHNIVKHAKATHVNIDLIKSNGTLILNVSDNGRGFDPEFSHTGNGLKSMQLRTKEIGGELQIESKVNQGTEVKLKVTIP